MEKVNFVNSVYVEILRGDICKLTADVLIVPEYCDRIAECKLIKKLFVYGSEKGMQTFEKFSKAATYEPGAVVLTEAGGNNRVLAHLMLDAAKKAEFIRALQKGIAETLLRAEMLKTVKSIAIPDFFAIAGNPLTPAETVAAIIEALADFNNVTGQIKEVTFVLDISEKEYETLKEELDRLKVFETEVAV